jgi:hypothetical protein
VDDKAPAKPELVVPAGAPLRAFDWLFPPVVLVGLAVIEFYAAMNTGSRGAPVFSIVAISLLVIAAVALWILGYRAYQEPTARTVEQYVLTAVVSLVMTGVFLSAIIAWIPLVWSGRLLAGRGLRPVRLVRTIMPNRLWLRTAVIAAIIGVCCLLLQPLASGLGMVPLVIFMNAGRILAPFVFGFAFRLRPRASGVF